MEEQKDNPNPGLSGSIAIFIAVSLAIAFATGLIAGVVLRPLIISDVPVQVVVTVVPNNNQSAAQVFTPQAAAESAITLEPTPATNSDLDPTLPATSEPEPSDATPTPTIMEFVMADARHFQGSDNAPVILVEFSDFK